MSRLLLHHDTHLLHREQTDPKQRARAAATQNDDPQTPATGILPPPPLHPPKSLPLHPPRTLQRTLQHLPSPLRYAEFFTLAASSTSSSDVTPILALHGLFVLMTRSNLEYPRSYPSLYRLVTPSVFYRPYLGVGVGVVSWRTCTTVRQTSWSKRTPWSLVCGNWRC